MEEDLNVYETIMILHERLTKEEVETKANEYIHNIIHGDGTTDGKIPAYVHKLDKMGKKKLAYEVKDCTSGWYLLFTYRTLPERIAELEKIMRNDDSVLKFITVKLDTDEAFAKIDLDTVISEQQPEDGKFAPYKKEVDAFDLIFGKAGEI